MGQVLRVPLAAFTNGFELLEFVGSKGGVVVDDVQVRILGIPDCGVFVVLGPS